MSFKTMDDGQVLLYAVSAEVAINFVFFYSKGFLCYGFVEKV